MAWRPWDWGQAAVLAGLLLLLTIRPEAMDLLPPGSGSEGRNRLEGKVAASAFQGAAIQYEVEVAGMLLRASVTNPKGKRFFHRGDPVAVVANPDPQTSVGITLEAFMRGEGA